jgi:hypothetical protein
MGHGRCLCGCQSQHWGLFGKEPRRSSLRSSLKLSKVYLVPVPFRFPLHSDVLAGRRCGGGQFSAGCIWTFCYSFKITSRPFRRAYTRE